MRVCETPGELCANTIAVGTTAAISAASWSGSDGISGALPVTYPDVSVICGPFARDVRDPHAVTNPVLVAEITSSSTEDYDRGAKLAHYQSIVALQTVLIVSHRARRLTLVSRSAEGWTTTSLGRA